ncbi:hypothetical protein H9L10_04490 [Phycicoccus endophyticus]|uniref:Tetratricopeptide repeat protein n=1 Tax=Phycicoccus endophyticus TaxID=1690220 RepID=A0A7G9R3X4_9MICO|nr:hypothetical protein [Phycicoccus endophyticus]NHI18133.1 hypothetical protein [Phycicoccus endophyticus]QNN50299.1 hypothetical protein H9L10_04490 [Phycicoccus endophyticus]GGL26182.1 hypothetical protein GCM10012283_05460 [Phycicoccus endophyticus]
MSEAAGPGPQVEADATAVAEAAELARGGEARARAGDLDAAVEAVRGAAPVLLHSPRGAQGTAACLRTLVRIGNTDRALDLLLPRVDRVATLEDPEDRMWFAATAAWVLRHARRLGMLPERVGHEDAATALTHLEATARSLAGEHANGDPQEAARALVAAHDDTGVASEPTLPPTRLPLPPAGDSMLRPPASAAEVAELAARARDWRLEVDPALERLLRGWLETREAALSLLSAPGHWAAAALLDRSSVHLLRDPVRERLRLEEAVSAAERGEDEEGVAHGRCELAVLDVREASARFGEGAPEVDRARERALAAVEDLVAHGWAETAALSRRWYALSTRPADAAEQLLRAAQEHERLGQPVRQALCLLDAAPPTFAREGEAGHRLLDEAERLAGEHPVLGVQVLDLRARVARARGDHRAAGALYARAAAVRDVPDGSRMAVLFAWCDLLVERAEWGALEPRAADALALAVRLRDPVALAVAQRHLGLSWLEQGRAPEAAELLAAAAPVVREHVPELLGPTTWALGNAALALGAWPQAREAFTSAAEAFEQTDRLEEASHARYRAGTAAWDGEDLATAATELDAAVALARRSSTVPVLLEALRSRAAVRAAAGDVDGGLAALDAVLADVERLAAARPSGEADDDAFDAEELEPDILREGAHVLADAGRTDEALERLTRAEALVGGEFELVLRAERGVVLAEADRLEQAEPLLRDSLEQLRAAGMAEERVAVAGALARALDRAGRVEDAEEVWGRDGPDD